MLDPILLLIGKHPEISILVGTTLFGGFAWVFKVAVNGEIDKRFKLHQEEETERDKVIYSLCGKVDTIISRIDDLYDLYSKK